MTKKSSHWVTIPEETVHTPVSKKEKSDSSPVKNKLFWGAGFIVLIIFTAALIAPNQLASLLQGNLFDQGMTIVPEGGFEDPQLTTSTVQEADTEEEVIEEEDVQVAPEETLVVQAQTDAVTIQIDPVGTGDEEFDVAYLLDCTEWEGIYDMGSSIEFEIKLSELDSETCNVYYKNTKNINPDFEGTEMDCSVPKGEYTEEEYADYMNENQLDTCSGSYVDLTNSLTGTVESDVKDELDANRKLLEELSMQITEFKEKDEEKTKIIEELADMVQKDELHSVAADTATEATTVIGTPATSTTTTTGYKVNTHTVTMTPQEALAQNTALSMQIQSGAYADVNAADYSAQLSNATGTVDSGPREILLVSFLLTFISLLGWRLKKIVQA